MAQHIADGKELRLVVLDDAAVRYDVYLTVGEGVESVDSLVGTHAGCQMKLYLHLACRHVLHLAYLQLAFLHRLRDTLLQGAGCLGERYLADDKCLIVELFYFCTYLQRASSLPVIIFRHVDTAAGREVRVEMELLTLEVLYCRVANLIDIVWKDT